MNFQSKLEIPTFLKLMKSSQEKFKFLEPRERCLWSEKQYETVFLVISKKYVFSKADLRAINTASQ